MNYKETVQFLFQNFEVNFLLRIQKRKIIYNIAL